MTAPIEYLIEELESSIATPVAMDLMRAISTDARTRALRMLKEEGFSAGDAKALYTHLRKEVTRNVTLVELPREQWDDLPPWTSFLVRFGTTITHGLLDQNRIVVGGGNIWEPLHKMHQIWMINKL